VRILVLTYLNVSMRWTRDEGDIHYYFVEKIR